MLDANLHSHPCPLVPKLRSFDGPRYHTHHIESMHGCQPAQTTLNGGGMRVGLEGCSPYDDNEGRPQDGCSGPLR